MNTEKKYELTEETTFCRGHELHRIRALKDFGTVKKGDLGGFIENEENLSHDGSCWVGGRARVCGCAQVRDNARVTDHAEVFGHAEIFNDAVVCNNARVMDHVQVFDTAHVLGDSMAYGFAKIHGNVYFDGISVICGDGDISAPADFCTIRNFPSSGNITFFKTKSGDIHATGMIDYQSIDNIENMINNGQMENADMWRALIGFVKLRFVIVKLEK